MTGNPYQPLDLVEDVSNYGGSISFRGVVTRGDLEALIGTRRAVVALWIFFAATLGPFALIFVAAAVFNPKGSFLESLPALAFLITLIAMAAWASFLLTKRSRVSRLIHQSPNRLDQVIDGTIDAAGLTIRSDDAQKALVLPWNVMDSVTVTANGIRFSPDLTNDNFFAVPANTIADFNVGMVEDFVDQYRCKKASMPIVATVPDWTEAPSGSFHYEAYVGDSASDPSVEGNHKSSLILYAGLLLFTLVALTRFDASVAPFIFIIGLTILVLSWDARRRNLNSSHIVYQHWGWLSDGSYQFHFPDQTYASDGSDLTAVHITDDDAVLTFNDHWMIHLQSDNIKNRPWEDCTALLQQLSAQNTRDIASEPDQLLDSDET